MSEIKRSIYQGKNYDYVYALDNYVIEKKQNSGICIIYCSSSGLYYPNTEEEFVNAFIKRNDKFEWKNNRIRNADKSIWIRDITKEFYVRGINHKINSIDKLVAFLKDETRGYKIITVGSSGGGYIATLIGCLLQAQKIYCFSGFFDLNIIDKETWPLVHEYGSQPKYQKWYCLRDIIEKSGTKVFYFYPGKLEGDKKQAEVVEGLPGVYSFRFDSAIHGIPFSDRFHVPVLNRVLNLSDEKLHMLYLFFRGKTITNVRWLFRVLFL